MNHVLFAFNVGRQRRGARSGTDREITPPMLAKVHGNLEVCYLT